MSIEGCVKLPTLPTSAAVRTAITLSAITVFTDPENGMTSVTETNPLTQNQFAVNRHVRPRTGLDNGCESCHVRTSLMR